MSDILHSAFVHSWDEEETKAGQTPPQAKAVKPTKRKRLRAHRRLNATPALLVEHWRIEKYGLTAEDQLNLAPFFFFLKQPIRLFTVPFGTFIS